MNVMNGTNKMTDADADADERLKSLNDSNMKISSAPVGDSSSSSANAKVKLEDVDLDVDKTNVHTFAFEFPPDKPHHILTADGVENIASHKYVGGEYTYLDEFMNPIWTYLTSLLPMSIAPNMITTIGGLHCLTAYLVLWYLSPNMDHDTTLPDWVLLLSGYCTFVYYTLDCMDGKQARRTSTSSPLGQLFDHGMDCFCNVFHPAMAAAYLMNGGTYYFFMLMSPLQFAFFTAQWEEYYTHVLPHGCGKWFGVTEVNYGLALISVINSFLDRKTFWFQTLQSALPANIVTLLSQNSFLKQHFLPLQYNEFGITVWLITMVVQCFLSFRRTLAHVPTFTGKLSAMSKLFSPFLLALTPFFVPYYLIQHHTRLVSIAMGLAFDLITKKMIVFSMAKMSFAMIQFEILPFLICVGLMLMNVSYPFIITSTEAELESAYVKIMIGVCVWNFYRLIRWCRLAILQITHRLDIYCFTIKQQQKKNKKV